VSAPEAAGAQHGGFVQLRNRPIGRASELAVASRIDGGDWRTRSKPANSCSSGRSGKATQPRTAPSEAFALEAGLSVERLGRPTPAAALRLLRSDTRYCRDPRSIPVAW